MTITLHYGQSSNCELDAADIESVSPIESSSLSSDEILRQIRSALRNPEGFPPLASATVPGDRVAIAVQSGLPGLQSVVEGTVIELLESGVEADQIKLLVPENFPALGVLEKTLGSQALSSVKLEVHDPDDPDALALLGITESNRPLRINRSLCDAELVLLCGVCQPWFDAKTPLYPCLFPAFSDRETIERFQSPAAWEEDNSRDLFKAEVDEAGWLLGIGLVVQVIPGPRGGVSQVLAGDPAVVVPGSASQYASIWTREVSQPGDLVVATLTGDKGEQTWESLGRALLAAELVVQEGGTIALYTELDQPPGRSLLRLAGDQNRAAIERQLFEEPCFDSGPAWQLCRALKRGPVYLRSLLASNQIESLGMTPIDSDQELQRLVQAYPRCIVLEEAQHLQPVLSNGSSPRPQP